MNKDDFDVVKKGEIHAPSYEHGRLDLLKELYVMGQELMKEAIIEINKKEQELGLELTPAAKE